MAPNDDGVGGVDFREGSVPLIIQLTDALSHAPGETHCFNSGYTGSVASVAATRSETQDALEDICARVITISSSEEAVNDCHPRYDGERWAEATDARVPPAIWDGPSKPDGCGDGECCTALNGTGRDPDADGLCPLVFDISADGKGLGGTVVQGVEALALYAPFSVDAIATGVTNSIDGDPLPASTNTADFIRSITPGAFSGVPLAGLPDPTTTSSGFAGVTPGTTLTFEIDSFNDFVPPTLEPQFFIATIEVSAGQCAGTKLDEHDVLILVPALDVTPQ